MTTSTVPDHPLPHLADKLDAINRTLFYMKVDQKSATSSLHFLVLRSSQRIDKAKQNSNQILRRKRLSGARRVGASVLGTGEAALVTLTGELSLVVLLLLATLLLTVTGIGSGSGSTVASGRGLGGSVVTSSGSLGGGLSRGIVAASGTASRGSTTPDLGAGHGEVLSTVVDGEVGVVIGLLVGTGELDHLGVDLAGATTGDGNLHAGDVVLGLVHVRSVDTDVLNAEEVLAIGGTLGDLDIGGGRVVVAPGVLGEVTAGVADTLLHDLEPVTVTLVGLDIATGVGHVSQSRSGVTHLSTDTELEGDHITSLDIGDLSVGTGGGGTLVADDVLAISERVVADIGGRVGGELDGVVLGSTGEVTDVLERSGVLAVDGGNLEEVVGRSDLREGSESDGGELHFERLVVEDGRKIAWFAGDWLVIVVNERNERLALRKKD
jgi:hypothetical protein